MGVLLWAGCPYQLPTDNTNQLLADDTTRTSYFPKVLYSRALVLGAGRLTPYVKLDIAYHLYRSHGPLDMARRCAAERVFPSQLTGPNPPNHRNDFSRPALRHGASNCLFQSALHVPSLLWRGEMK